MPKKQSAEKQIRRLIEETLRSYITAARNRRRALEYCEMAFKINTWEEKAPKLSTLAATLARVCDSMSHELQALYSLEERLRQVADKGLHIVIEHVESPWRPEHPPSVDGDAPPQNGPAHHPAPADTEQGDA